MNFNYYETEQAALEYIESNGLAESLLLSDKKSHVNDELELINWWANENGLIASEEDLSEQFDQLISESVNGMDYQTASRYLSDRAAISQDFSSYADALTRDGELHLLQYENYEYVGEYLNE